MGRLVEIWKPIYINGELTQYMISDAGRVKNVKTGCIRKTKPGPNGYVLIHLRHNNKDITARVHRLVAEAFIDNPDNKPTVNHKEKGFNSRSNNDVRNLEWATYHEQVMDTIKKGTHVGASSGEYNYFANHLTKQIHHVCRLLENNELPVKEISKITGVSKDAIYKIMNFETWHDITSQYDIKNYTINRPYPNELKEKILSMYLKGYSFKKICKKLKLPIENRIRCLFYQIKKDYKAKSPTTNNTNDEYYTIDIHI